MLCTRVLPCDSVILHDMQLPSHGGLPRSPTLQPTLHRGSRGAARPPKLTPTEPPTNATYAADLSNKTKASNPRSDLCRTKHTRRQGSTRVHNSRYGRRCARRGTLELLELHSTNCLLLSLLGKVWYIEFQEFQSSKSSTTPLVVTTCHYVKNIDHSTNYFISEVLDSDSE